MTLRLDDYSLTRLLDEPAFYAISPDERFAAVGSMDWANPEEQFSVVRSNPDIVKEAKSLLDEQARQAERLRKHYGVTSGEAKPLDPETEERLKSLGYVQ